MRGIVDAILLIGPTGAGKSPLGDHIEERGLSGRRCHHFDFGSQLRRIGQDSEVPQGFTSEEHLFVREVLEKALLLEREHFPIARKIVSSFLDMRRYEKGDMVILNGLPRHVEQAIDMDSLFSVRALVVLDCPPEVVHKRISKNTGGDRTGRDDDDISLIEKKLRIFKTRTAALVGHYSKRSCRIITLDVTPEATAGDVYAELLMRI